MKQVRERDDDLASGRFRIQVTRPRLFVPEDGTQDAVDEGGGYPVQGHDMQQGDVSRIRERTGQVHIPQGRNL